MRGRGFRPRFAGGGGVPPRFAGRPGLRRRGAGRGRKLRSRVLIAGAVILAAVVAWVGVQLLRPVPAMTLTASVTRVRVLPGAAPRPAWPGRAEAAVGLPGTGLLGASGGGRPVPIASLAKIMTGYLVLRDHPLPAGGSGPAITVTAADAAAYASDQRQGQSGVQVAPGGEPAAPQALHAKLLPSRHHHGSLLAPLDAGSPSARP